MCQYLPGNPVSIFPHHDQNHLFPPTRGGSISSGRAWDSGRREGGGGPDSFEPARWHVLRFNRATILYFRGWLLSLGQVQRAPDRDRGGSPNLFLGIDTLTKAVFAVAPCCRGLAMVGLAFCSLLFSRSWPVWVIVLARAVWAFGTLWPFAGLGCCYGTVLASVKLAGHLVDLPDLGRGLSLTLGIRPKYPSAIGRSCV